MNLRGMILKRFREDKELNYFLYNDPIIYSLYTMVDKESRPEGIIDAIVETIKLFTKKNEELQNKLTQEVLHNVK